MAANAKHVTVDLQVRVKPSIPPRGVVQSFGIRLTKLGAKLYGRPVEIEVMSDR